MLRKNRQEHKPRKFKNQKHLVNYLGMLWVSFLLFAFLPLFKEISQVNFRPSFNIIPTRQGGAYGLCNCVLPTYGQLIIEGRF